MLPASRRAKGSNLETINFSVVQMGLQLRRVPSLPSNSTRALVLEKGLTRQCGLTLLSQFIDSDPISVGKSISDRCTQRKLSKCSIT